MKYFFSSGNISLKFNDNVIGFRVVHSHTGMIEVVAQLAERVIYGTQFLETYDFLNVENDLLLLFVLFF